jgi:hypothetical protein
MTSDTVWQLIRYALLLAFGPLVTKGYISSDQVTTVIGAIGALFVVGWGIYVKFGTKATTAEVAAKPTVPVVSPATGQVK